MDKKYNGLNFDLYIAVAYIPPTNSSLYRSKCQIDPFVELKESVNAFSALGQVVIMGDLNSRTASLKDYVIDDSAKYLPIDGMEDIYNIDVQQPNRNNEDSVVNQFGKKLIRLCQESRLRILNGRTLGDLQGNVTCYKYNGKSLVDYVIVSEELMCKIEHFKVMSEVKDVSLSDHFPILASVNMSILPNINVNPDDSKTISPDYKWNKDSEMKFQAALQQPDIVSKLNELKMKMTSSESTDINLCCDEATSIFQKTASRSLKLKRQGVSKKKKKKWSDKSCTALRKEINLLKSLISSDVSNPYLVGRYCVIKKRYRKLVKANNRKVKEMVMKKIESLESADPRAFWHAINEWRTKRTHNDDIDIKSLFDHLKTLGTSRSRKFDENFEAKINKSLQKLSLKKCPLLDKPISEKEIVQCVKELKNGKAVGEDKISNEMIKCGITVFAPILKCLFNAILAQEKVPLNWGKGWIIPIYKSGPKNNPQNYRPITISSCLCKVFTRILNNRLSQFIDKNNSINEFQIGFKKGARTTDHIFLLKTIIDFYKSKKRHIYACFVDFSSAFPSVWRNGLYYKLLKEGISSKFVNIVKSLYSNTECAIKIDNKISDTFKSTIGTRQGCNLSPTLFNFYTNDLPKLLSESDVDPVQLDKKPIPLLMYADDIVLLSKSQKGLQCALNVLSLYCHKWKLSINMKKTKIMIFNSRNDPSKKFFINSDQLAITGQYTYLGIIFTPSGSFKRAIDTLTLKATKAWNSISQNFSIWNGTPVKILLKLFTSIAQPIMLYGSEIWGSYLFRKPNLVSFTDMIFNPKLDSEKFHLKVCKQMLGINRKSSNISSLLELGRYPIVINIYKALIVYLLRIMNTAKSPLLNTALSIHNGLGNMSMLNFTNLPVTIACLIGYIKKGFRKNCISKGKLHLESKKIMMKLQAAFVQIFPSIINQNKKLCLYANIKRQFRLEPYLNNVTNVKHRVSICKFRTSSHNLPIEVGRYNGLEQNERFCKMCTQNEIGTELHVLFNCNNEKIVSVRGKMQNEIENLCNQFIKLSNESKLVYNLSCCDKDITNKIGVFVCEVLDLHKLLNG